MEKIIVELEAKTNKAEASLQDVVNAIQDINKATTQSNQDTAKSLKEVEKSSSKAAKGIKRIGNAIKAAGIGLLLAAFTTLKEVFMQNQKAADLFNTAFEVVSIAFNDFVGFIDKNLGTITGFFKDIFENPTKKISELGSVIKQGLIDRFNQLLEVFGLVGKSLGQLVRGEFSAAFDTIKEAGKQTVDVVTGVDDSFESVAETITEYTKKTIKAAKSNVELAKAAEIASVKNQGLIEKYDRQAEQQRQIRDDESKSIEDRIKANDELAKILDKQEEAMLKNADIAVASAKAELDKNKENIQLQKAYQEALNERAGIESRLGRAILIAKQLLQAREMIMEMKGTLFSAKQSATKTVVKAAEAGVDVSSGAAKAASAAPFPANIPLILGYAAQAVGIVSAIRGAMKASKQATSKLGVSETSPKIATPPTVAASIPPAFNIVGASGTNQLASAIGGQSQQPIQAFVVSSEVSTAQELDRNIIDDASIGG